MALYDPNTGTAPKIGDSVLLSTSVNGKNEISSYDWAGNLPTGYQITDPTKALSLLNANSANEYDLKLTGALGGAQLSQYLANPSSFSTDFQNTYKQLTATRDAANATNQTYLDNLVGSIKPSALSQQYLPDAPTPSTQYYKPEYVAQYTATNGHAPFANDAEQNAWLQEMANRGTPVDPTTLQPAANQTQIAPGKFVPTGSAGATAQQAGPQTNPNTTATGAAAPTVALQPGNTGDAVKQLQDYLVSLGLMTPAQIATGYGTYGPQTTAAVAALQQKLGVDNSTGVGYFGPKTMAAISASGGASGGSTNGTTTGGTSGGTGSASSQGTSSTSSNDPYAGMDPIAKQVKMYTDAATALGLPTIKGQYEKVLKQQSDLTNELNDKLQEIQNNPWYSQSVVDREQARTKDKYEARLDTMSHLATLYDSLYKQGQAQVNTIVGGAQDDIQAANTLAQKQLDAAAAIARDNQVVTVGGRQVLVNKVTGKVVADLGASTSGTGGGGTFTASQTNSGAANAGISIDAFKALSDDDKNYFINGYGAFTALQKAIDSGTETADSVAQTIQSSNLSDAVKNILYKKIGSTPGAASTASTSGVNDFFGGIGAFFSEGLAGWGL